jgi:chromosome segregation ATPase
MSDKVFEFLRDLITIITPFLLVYIAYRSNKKEKINTEYKTLLETNLRLEKELADKKKEEMNNSILKLQKDVQDLRNSISDIRNNMNSISEEVRNVNHSLKDLLRFNNVNLSYCQSLSCLITCIGENIKEDNTTIDSITKAIVIHQQKERELFSSIFKSSC